MMYIMPLATHWLSLAMFNPLTHTVGISVLWASECPDVKNYKWRLNSVWHTMLHSCTHMATVGTKGLMAQWRCWLGTVVDFFHDDHVRRAPYVLSIRLTCPRLSRLRWMHLCNGIYCYKIIFGLTGIHCTDLFELRSDYDTIRYDRRV